MSWVSQHRGLTGVGVIAGLVILTGEFWIEEFLTDLRFYERTSPSVLISLAQSLFASPWFQHGLTFVAGAASVSLITFMRSRRARSDLANDDISQWQSIIDSATAADAAAADDAATTTVEAVQSNGLNNRQFYDQRLGRYYFFDPKFQRYFWEDGSPRY